MVTEIAALLTSFLISMGILPLIINYSVRRNFGDTPGKRKIHRTKKPSLGGIAIFFGFLMATILFSDFLESIEVKFIVSSVSIIFLLGLIDDITHLPALYKLIGQVLAITLIVLLIDIRLKSFYDIFPGMQFPLAISYFITVFSMIIIINAVNLIDGLDGLAGAICIISLTSFGLWFYLVDQKIYSLLCGALTGGIMAFLLFNWQPSKIFMGDTGSLVLGMIISIFAIKFIDLNHNLPKESIYKFSGSVGTAVCLVSIPLVDTARIIILRLYKGKSPLAPDKNHIHHTVLRLTKSHSQTTFILATIHLGYVLLAFVLRNYSDVFVLSGVILASLIFSLTLNKLIVGRLPKQNALKRYGDRK